MKTLIIGLGNPILTDDGVGVIAARQVNVRLAGDPYTEVTELSVGGLRLMEAMIGYERVILIDALDAGDGKIGAIHRLTLNDLEEISPTQHSASPHDASLATAIAIGRQMGYTLPQEIIIYTVEVENTSDFGETLTPAVARAMPDLVEWVLAEVGKSQPEVEQRYELATPVAPIGSTDFD